MSASCSESPRSERRRRSRGRPGPRPPSPRRVDVACAGQCAPTLRPEQAAGADERSARRRAGRRSRAVLGRRGRREPARPISRCRTLSSVLTGMMLRIESPSPTMNPQIATTSRGRRARARTGAPRVGRRAERQQPERAGQRCARRCATRSRRGCRRQRRRRPASRSRPSRRTRRFPPRRAWPRPVRRKAWPGWTASPSDRNQVL